MLDDARWHSEPFPPGGGISAEGARNQLGRPELSTLEVLVREAIQNSWDARRTAQKLRFDISAWELDGPPADTAAALLERNVAGESVPLLDSTGVRPLRFLALADRGTTGLGGPTRADTRRMDGASHDFVAFVRNIGEPRDREFGAGTFGFGKAAFYTASAAQTIFIHTRCENAGVAETRFIGCSLGRTFNQTIGTRLRPFTGRHWWGRYEDGVVEPLRDQEADEAAYAIGLDAFDDDDLGTTIVVVDPLFENPPADLEGIAHALVWHAWPKLIVKDGGGPEIACSVSWNRSEIPIPDPETTTPISGFVAAYRALDRGRSITTGRPSRRLGTLAVRRRLVPLGAVEAPLGHTPPLQSPTHHVALLRTAGFIVKYQEGPPLGEDFAEYAGVFQVEADPVVDEAFAAAEPPTHDDWVHHQLRGEQKTFVRVALDKVRAEVRAMAQPLHGGEITSAAKIPLGHASARFASLVGTTPGTGAAVSVPGKGGEGPGGRVVPRPPNRHAEQPDGSVRPAGSPEFGRFRSTPAILFPCEITAESDSSHVEAVLGVAVDDGERLEVESPSGAPSPSVLGWIGPAGEQLDTKSLPTTGRKGAVWRLAVQPAPDTLTVVRFRVITIDA